MAHNIVKVQMPIFTNASSGEQEALVYNEDHSIDMFVPVSEVKRPMNGELKQYFHYKIQRGELAILGIAPWQEW